MTKLELIKEEIKTCKKQIERFKAEGYASCIIKIQKNRLSLLKQIKTDLEAWKAVKRNMEHPSEDHDILAFCISESYSPQTKDYKKILKAFEAQND